MRLNPTVEVHCDCPCCENAIIVTLPNLVEGLEQMNLEEAIFAREWSIFMKGGYKKTYDLCTDCGMHGPKKIRKSEEEE